MVMLISFHSFKSPTGAWYFRYYPDLMVSCHSCSLLTITGHSLHAGDHPLTPHIRAHWKRVGGKISLFVYLVLTGAWATLCRQVAS